MVTNHRNVLFGKEYFENGDVSIYNKLGGYDSRIMKISRRLILKSCVKKIVRHSPNPPCRHLDIGCAYGYVCEMFRKHGFESFGIDISNWAINMASKRFREYKFEVCDIEKSRPFNSIKFGLVTAFEVLEHCKRIDCALQNINLLLNENGIFAISVPNADTIPYSDFKTDATHVNYYSNEKWLKTIEGFGFERVTNFYYPGLFKKIKPMWGINCMIFRKVKNYGKKA